MALAAFMAYGVAGLGLGGTWGLATGLFFHHTRHSRVARLALAGREEGQGTGAAEGPVLLGGLVEAAEDQQPGAVLSVEVGGSESARPFSLHVGGGETVRVEPEEGRWSLDTTFVAMRSEPGSGRTRYAAAVGPGDEIYVRGTLRREHDPRAAGRGYRDASRLWVVRGDLTFCSGAVVAAHAARAAFHARWAVALAFAFGSLHLAIWLATDPDAGLDARGGPLAVLAVAALAVFYWFCAESSVPWVRRTVRVR